MKIDNGKVANDVKLGNLKQWKLRAGKEMPFYINTGEGSLVFNGKPETVRDLWRTYTVYRYNTFIEFVSFLNEEGVAARKIPASLDKILGYHIELSYN